MSASFLTGSRVYGTPVPASDYDLVVLVSHEDLKLLEAAAGKPPIDPKYPERLDAGSSLRFGKLNLIALTDEGDFEKWRAATEALKARKPVSRVEAVAAIKAALGEAP